MKDYYQILDIPSSADIEAIKSAYYNLAKKFHPDKNTRNPYYSADKFREIQEAYRILSNEQEKATYDQHFIYLQAQQLRHFTRDRRNVKPRSKPQTPSPQSAEMPQTSAEKFDMFRSAFLKKQKEIHQQYQEEKAKEQRDQKKSFQEAFKRNQAKLREEQAIYTKPVDEVAKAQKRGKQVTIIVVGMLVVWLVIIFLILNDMV
ncbi:DnaJ domain-containing protein [uncultured Microscilla sp.]|uniref:J domain-containing protein n=1 Tax=uncultured Microscilla sp. TaxID=432653 RepID=UPI00260D5227|nr:DnaJ domain-containing protein [uncultured Microscilla sp.]